MYTLEGVRVRYELFLLLSLSRFMSLVTLHGIQKIMDEELVKPLGFKIETALLIL
jgi:hypothetical protein